MSLCVDATKNDSQTQPNPFVCLFHQRKKNYCDSSVCWPLLFETFWWKLKGFILKIERLFMLEIHTNEILPLLFGISCFLYLLLAETIFVGNFCSLWNFLNFKDSFLVFWGDFREFFCESMSAIWNFEGDFFSAQNLNFQLNFAFPCKVQFFFGSFGFGSVLLKLVRYSKLVRNFQNGLIVFWLVES